MTDSDKLTPQPPAGDPTSGSPRGDADMKARRAIGQRTMTINAVRSRGRVTTTHWLLLALVLTVALAGCDGWSTVTMHHKTCRGAGDSGRCEGGYGTLRGAHPETIESELLSDAVEVRAEVTVEQGRVNVSVVSPEGDVTGVEATPAGPAVLQGVAEVSFDEFDVTFEAIDEQARGISYTIDYRSPQTSAASPGEEPSGSGSGRSEVAGQPLSDLLTLLPAGEDFWIAFSDLDAHRDAIGATMPPASASTDALAAHAERLNKGGGPPFGSVFEENPSLSPLARGSAYALMGWDGPRTQQQQDDFFSIDNVQVVAGGFADDAFGRPKPDHELDGVRTAPVTKPPFEVLSDADTVTGRLTVEDGVATLADYHDELAAALDAQRGDAPSMADVPAAARLFAVLDELDVINGTAQVPPDSSDAVDAVAAGVAVDPDRAGSWHMVVAHHVRDDANATPQSSVPGSSNIEFATEQLAALAADFAEEHDTEVMEVAPHGGDVAVAIIPVDNPIVWAEQSDTTLAMLWADPDLPRVETEGDATEGTE